MAAAKNQEKRPAKKMSCLQVLSVLRRRFQHVQLKNWDEEAKTAEVWVSLDRELAGPFKKRVEENLRTTNSDTAWQNAAGDVLQDKLAGLPAHQLELLGSYSYSDDLLPSRVSLFFRLGASKKKNKKKSKVHQDIGGHDVREPGDDEAVRSKRRRAREAKTKVEAGALHSAGRSGYVEREIGTGGDIVSWRPTPAAMAVMNAAISVWGTPACNSHMKLAKYLNERNLRSLDGKVFKKNMMRRLVLAVEFLRGNEK